MTATWSDVPHLVLSLLAKEAIEGGGFMKPLADGFADAQKPLGGPNPLAATIVGGLATAGIGHIAGGVASQFLPRRTGKRVRDMATIGGGLLGAAPGALWAGNNYANSADSGAVVPGVHPALAPLVSPWPFKSSADSTGGLSMASIPVDAFNRVVWSDVAVTPNPWGTKSPWGDNSQSLRTPAPAAAAITGIITGVSATTGQDYVSPLQVGMAAAAAGGKGYATGMVVGKLLGALVGLSEDEQSLMRRVGAWSGAISTIANHIFG